MQVVCQPLTQRSLWITPNIVLTCRNIPRQQPRFRSKNLRGNLRGNRRFDNRPSEQVTQYLSCITVSFSCVSSLKPEPIVPPQWHADEDLTRCTDITPHSNSEGAGRRWRLHLELLFKGIRRFFVNAIQVRRCWNYGSSLLKFGHRVGRVSLSMVVRVQFSSSRRRSDIRGFDVYCHRFP